MARKTKKGKQRKDRYYHLAKETGYRSRAAFKLIQLNRKFEFLQKSKVLIDLCAAPGGWLQVAQKYMPVSSVIVGIDLVPIRAIHNVITIQDDITTKHCRNELEKELKTWKADVVLHDGAGNIGKSWLHDAYGQNRLTLSACRLATEFLVKGGWFITKVFRSKDYNALMWVFKKLFNKVHATKPQASRNESAEIFVVCQGFISPDKIDPKFFDPSFVFEDIESKFDEKKVKSNLLKPALKQKKAKADGYADGDYTLFHKLKASELISSINHIQLLSETNEIDIDTKEIREHRLTTNEIKECCKDIKVLGRKELILLLDWRKKLRAELVKEDKTAKVDEIDENETQNGEVSEEDEVDRYMNEEAKDAKRKKRKVLKEKRKLNERMNLKMVLKNDEIIEEELELFQLRNIKNKKQLAKVEEIDLSDVEVDVEDNEGGEQTFLQKSKTVSYSKDSNKSINDFEDSGVDEDEEENEEIETQEVLDEPEMEDNNELQNTYQESDEESDGLVVDLDDNDQNRRDKTEMFFQNEMLRHEMDDSEDEDIELELIENRLKYKNSKQRRDETNETNPNKFVKSVEKEDNEEESDSSSDDENESSNKKRKNENIANEKCKKKVKLNGEELAIGTLMIKSSKTKRDIIDNAWNRYVHEDDEFLPSWFRKDEEKHNRKPIPVTEDMVKEYKQQLKEINAQPIKKVAEAKARKKKKALRKLERARKRAENITNAPDMSNKEKAEHIKSAYKKALRGNKKDVQYVVSKKHQGKRRPKGVKGRYKVVDPRMKKDKKERTTDKKSKFSKKSKPTKSKRPPSKPQQKQSRPKSKSKSKRKH